MKQSEAVRIPALLAARQPRPVVEEATIAGIHMLVIIGNEVDTVIRYNQRGGADMPQLSSYPEVAEAAADADQRLAKQRDSGRRNTTGEGKHWPYNWKLAKAMAARKIWYAGTQVQANEPPQKSVSTIHASPVASPVLVKSVADDHDAVSTIAKGSWRWCAEDYLKEIWWPQDRQLVREFSGKVNCEMLHNLCVLYRVARTVPGYGIEKYLPFVEMLNSYRETVMTKESVPEIIEQELSKMVQVYGRSFLSAITKAFWMMKQHPIAIYDSYARRGLRRRRLSSSYPSYREYHRAWFDFFEHPDTRNAINDVISWLPESPSVQSLLRSGELDAHELRSLSESMWFRNRVADRRLCFEGGAVEFK
jgi:hypothetical protein